MNEQLIVKNFGPIKDATVDFKKVTVFIGPTGGGKSTLAKLAALFRDEVWIQEDNQDFKVEKFKQILNGYSILDYLKDNGSIEWNSLDQATYNPSGLYHNDSRRKKLFTDGFDTFNAIAQGLTIPEPEFIFARATQEQMAVMNAMYPPFADIYYIPADRAFAAALESGLAGLTLNNIALPEALLSFINQFKIAQNSLQLFPLDIPFFRISYKIINKQPRLIIDTDETIELGNSASGMQAVVPMMLVINNSIKRRKKPTNPQSFIIEEPELNLYPSAQQGLLNWLVEKCTQGENDLTITTHSPYILAHLNLLLYAYQVAEKHPDRADDVAKIVPRESWINPKEFACYHVEGQKENGVHSIVNPETELISYNGLDSTATAEASDFEKLLDINAGLEVE